LYDEILLDAINILFSMVSFRHALSESGIIGFFHSKAYRQGPFGLFTKRMRE
jgi:hypothetical protein